MSFPVIRAAAYALVHTPNILLEHGTTQTMERAHNPEAEYLQKLPQHLRPFEEVVAYPPNQAYIGAISPDKLAQVPQPWYEHNLADVSRFARYGEIMAEDEFYALMKIVDAFDLVLLEKGFAAEIKAKLADHPMFNEKDLQKIGEGVELTDVEQAVNGHIADAFRLGERLVGCVRRAHDSDESLAAHIMFENLASKASGTLAFRHLLIDNQINPEEIDYVIECSEEAAGDMNQRGGGNFAKAIGEMVGAKNATGCDIRGFCAGPAHAMVNAAALVKSGVFKNVVVVAGGATAKLGMNGRDHVKKNMPVLEDTLGAFAILLSENDGVNPIVRTDIVGRHVIGSGASPQAVISAIVTDPLDRVGLKITDIDRYSVEMQNPEITVPAGAGNVPEANYKMIAALGVRRGDIQRADIPKFVKEHGMPGFAPTQGHIPSGIPFIGLGREMILNGEIERCMIVGKGSLFLARLTNLFDGISFVIEKNPGLQPEQAAGISSDEIRKLIAEAMRELAQKLAE
ncbi:MAG: glycine/sarcosine/betaine reductase complex component C subunit beta [Bacillota bacterium]|jgi:hypothetical protein